MDSSFINAILISRWLFSTTLIASAVLIEETGYVPSFMQHLGSFYQDQGCSAAFNQSFLAVGCKKNGRQYLDGDEFIKYFECSYDEVLELVNLGYISDCQSQLTIERSRPYMKK